jgi:hypothetical protein
MPAASVGAGQAQRSSPAFLLLRMSTGREQRKTHRPCTVQNLGDGCCGSGSGVCVWGGGVE